MLTLNTRTKLRIAKILSASVLFARRLAGKKSYGIFQRGAIKWNLDLSEGIDLSIFLFGCFERDVRKAYDRIIGSDSVILDIGANIGAHALPMALRASPAGKVYAFEPTLFAFEKMKANLKLNPELNRRVELQHILLNDGFSPAPEAIPSSWSLSNKSDSSVHPTHGGYYKPLGDAKVTSVDAFVEHYNLQKVDLIKLDVDGNEWSIIQGAQKTLEDGSPVILMEFAPYLYPTDFERILNLLQSLDYAPFSLDEKSRLPLNLQEINKMIPSNGSINVLLRKQRSN